MNLWSAIEIMENGTEKEEIIRLMSDIKREIHEILYKYKEDNKENKYLERISIKTAICPEGVFEISIGLGYPSNGFDIRPSLVNLNRSGQLDRYWYKDITWFAKIGGHPNKLEKIMSREMVKEIQVLWDRR